MSLQRVRSVETFTDLHSRRDSDATVRPRKLTFNPVPQGWESSPASTTGLRTVRSTSSIPNALNGSDHAHHQEGRLLVLSTQPTPNEPVSAFQVPKWKRICEFALFLLLFTYPSTVQIAAAVVYCLFAAGIVFGYAALKPVLIAEGVYESFCPPGDDACVEIHLNLMFTVAAVGTNVAALPVGAILDHYGPRVCGVLGSLFLFAGAAILANTFRLPFDALLLGYLCLALGGPFIFISSFQLSNAFPQHSGLILALLTGAFDSSSALFLVYRLIFDATDGAFDHTKFFTVYLIIPIIILILQIVLLPAQSYKTVGELVDQAEEAESVVAELSGNAQQQPYLDQIDEHTALLQTDSNSSPPLEIEADLLSLADQQSILSNIDELLGSSKGAAQVASEKQKNTISGIWGVMHSRTTLQQITSPWYILICLFTIVQMTRINFFVATIRTQYEVIFGSAAQARRINEFFDIALPVGGIISIPFIGVTLDHTSTLVVLSALVSIATLIGVLGIMPYPWAAYAGVCLFVLYRPFYYTAVSDYSAKVFGFRTFGTVYGLIICLSGLFNFSQSGLDVLLHRTFGGDPVPVDVGLLTLGAAVGGGLCIFVAWQVKRVGHFDTVGSEVRGEVEREPCP